MSERDRKRLGRGLEDISYLFSSSTSPFRSSPPFPTSSLQPEGQLRIIACHSDIESLPSAFLTCNLAIKLAQAGKRVLIADICNHNPDEWDVLSLMGLIPEAISGPLPLWVEGPHQIKILTFSLDPDRFSTLSWRNRLMHLSNLLPVESETDYVLLNLSIRGDPPATSSWFCAVQEVLLLIEARSRVGLCDRMKLLQAQNPDLRISLLLLADSERSPQAYALLEDISREVSAFSGNARTQYWLFPFDPAIPGSILDRKPLLLTRPDSPVSHTLQEVSRYLSKVETGSVPHPSFFLQLLHEYKEKRGVLHRCTVSDVVELENLVLDGIGWFGDGIKIFWHPFSEGDNYSALLGIDRDSRLALFVLSTTTEDRLLAISLSIYKRVSSTFPMIRKRYGVDVQSSLPSRLFILAPSFSEAVTESLQSLKPPIALCTFTGIEEDGEKTLLFETVAASY